jgi:hypothetical protein
MDGIGRYQGGAQGIPGGGERIPRRMEREEGSHQIRGRAFAFQDGMTQTLFPFSMRGEGGGIENLRVTEGIVVRLPLDMFTLRNFCSPLRSCRLCRTSGKDLTHLSRIDRFRALSPGDSGLKRGRADGWISQPTTLPLEREARGFGSTSYVSGGYRVPGSLLAGEYPPFFYSGICTTLEKM